MDDLSNLAQNAPVGKTMEPGKGVHVWLHKGQHLRASLDEVPSTKRAKLSFIKLLLSPDLAECSNKTKKPLIVI